jgi:hypothetical protein
MIRALALLLALPAAAHAAPLLTLPVADASTAPSAASPPSPPSAPSAPLPAPGFLPDPVAVHPAGLDPLTLCAGACAPVPTPPPTPAPPLHLSASALAAALSYTGHPTRSSGTELTARVELWRGLRWAAHVGYTADVISPVSPFAGPASTYNDLQLGGRLALPTSRPAWLTATAHALVGTPTTGGNGAALYAAGGAHVAGLDLELGAGATSLDDNLGITGDLRATRREGPLAGWLELDVNDATISGASSAHVSGAAGLDLRLGRVTFDLASHLGDRALAPTDGGELVDAVPDTFHASARALLDIALGRVHPYVGASARDATTPDGATYTLYAGFAGLTLTF